MKYNDTKKRFVTLSIGFITSWKQVIRNKEETPYWSRITRINKDNKTY